MFFAATDNGMSPAGRYADKLGRTIEKAQRIEDQVQEFCSKIYQQIARGPFGEFGLS